MAKKLSMAAVKRLRAPTASGKQEIEWDAELKGFGVLCSGVSGTKSFIVQRKLKDGRTRRVTIGTVAEFAGAGKSVDDARSEAADIIHAIRQGHDPKRRADGASTDMTLAQALDLYLRDNNQLSERSRAGYRATIERHLAAWFIVPLRDISADMVRARHKAIREEVSGEDAGGASANSSMRVFRAIWNYTAALVPDLPPNPTRVLRRAWFAVPPRTRVVRSEDLPKFYAAVCDLRNHTARDYLLLLLFTGLRRNEAATLTWDDVDFDERAIRLPAARTKARRRLDLPITDFVFDLLKARFELGRDASGFVFPGDGKTGHIAEPKFPLNKVALACGVLVSAHDLRRTYITVAEGCDIANRALKALVNHSPGRDVTGDYIIMTLGRLREPAQLVADRLKSLCGNPAPSAKDDG